MTWKELSATSHYQAAVAIKDELQRGHTAEAMTGVEELIEALSRSEKRALKSQLIRLMLHVIKWEAQSDKRTLSWVASINDARDEIADIQEETPSLTAEVVSRLWDKCFTAAKRTAEGEIGKKTTITHLSWAEVFEDSYDL